MKYPDASKMRYRDASKPQAGIRQVRVTGSAPATATVAPTSSARNATPAPAARARIAAAAIFAPAAAAQSGNLPPPAAAAAAAGNSPLQVPQAAMVIGEPIPVVWGRRRGNVGGVLVFPRATEARFGNGATTVTSRYHMVLGEGQIPDIQVRDVRCGECRIGSFSQNYNQRAGSWTPGNFATAQAGYTVATFPTFTGGGGRYQGLSTFEAGATFPGGSDDWRTGWNVFLRGGTIVERGRLLDSVVGPSDNVADLVLWALQRSGRAPDAMIDFPSLLAAAQFTEANGLWCNGEFANSVNLGDQLIRLLPEFLLRETKIGGRFGLRPLLPTNSDGTINTGPIEPRWVLTEAAIKPGSYQINYSDAATLRPTPLAMLWRQQHDDSDVPIVRTLTVGDPNAPGPLEQHDLSQSATTEDHAAKVGTYKFMRSTLSTHTASVVLKPGNQTGQIVEGDVVQIFLYVETNREPVSTINHYYLVESIGHDLAGDETLNLSHFPVNSSGQSLIALAVAAAVGTGTILPSQRTGSSCDLPGAASDTSVPAKSTGGTPFGVAAGGGGSGGGGGGGSSDDKPAVDPNGGEGEPTDDPPPPNTGGAKDYANNGGQVPGSGGGDESLCPNGFYGYVTGSVFSGRQLGPVDASSSQLYFTSFSLPEISPNGEPDQFGPAWRSNPYRVDWFGWAGSVVGPPTSQTRNITSLTAILPGYSDFLISFTASYTCSLPDGSAGTPVTNRRLHTVVKGDTMENLSQRYYGTPSRADDIRDANPEIMGLDNWGLHLALVLQIPT
jgi:nucleoid-associated protein YgaU